MISRSEMLPLLVRSCSSFSEKWENHKVEYADEEDFLPYVAFGAFSSHLVGLDREQNESQLKDVFSVIERLHVEGDSYVREAVTVGLLEGLQNQMLHAGRTGEELRAFMSPETEKWWDELNRFWNGQSRYVGENIL